MCSFMCFFPELEHIAHYKAKNQNTVKSNSLTHVQANTHICMHAQTHARTHTDVTVNGIA